MHGDTKVWCYNPVVSSIRFYCISDSKCSSQCIVNSRGGKMDIAALLYSSVVLVPIMTLYHCTSLLFNNMFLLRSLSNTQVNVVDLPSHMVSSSGP